MCFVRQRQRVTIPYMKAVMNIDENNYYVKVDVGGKANSSSEALLAISSFAEAIEDVLKK